jgi:hypothetical protein
MEGEAFPANVDVNDNKIAADIAESATEAFTSTDTGVNAEDYFVSQQAHDAVFQAFTMELVELGGEAFFTAHLWHRKLFAAGLHFFAFTVPVRIFVVHRSLCPPLFFD